METKNLDKKAELCFEVVKDLDALVNHFDQIKMDAKKSREIVMMIPNVGPEAVESLRQTLVTSDFPDLQLSYLENLLDQEAKLNLRKP